jgi:long-chain fatty acid transport protein
MDRTRKKQFRAFSVALILMACSGGATATNGYFPHGYGAVNRGLAGAGVVWSQDVTAGAVNPAGFVDVGNRLDLGVEGFSPQRSYTVLGSPSFDPAQTRVPGLLFPLAPGKVESGRRLFPIPSIGWSRQLDARSAFGVSVYANGGMNTSYPAFDNPYCPPGSAGGSFCAGATGVDLAQLFVSPVYARRLTDNLAIGIAPIFAGQRFEATGISSFAPLSAEPSALSDNGHETSFGLGIRLGLQGTVGNRLRWGLAWRNKVSMGALKKYRGLFANGGEFDIPQSIVAGIAWDFGSANTLLIDVEHVGYGDVDSVGSPLLPNLAGAPLGGGRGPGFGWKDVTTIKLGYQLSVSDRWRFRAGVSHADQPIPDSEVLFNILAPGVQEWHYTVGVTRRLANGNEVTAGLMYSPEKTVSGANPFNLGQVIALSMHQWAFELSWSFGGRRTAGR